MAITFIETKKPRKSYQQKNQKTATRTIKARSTEYNTTVDDVLEEIDILIGDELPGNSELRCVSIDVDASEPKIFDIIYEYDNQYNENDPANDPDQQQQDPIEEPARVFNISWRPESEVAYQDYGDPPKLYLNSSGQMFADPKHKNTFVLVINVQNNLILNSALVDLIGDYQEAINSDTFAGRPPGTVRLAGCSFTGPYTRRTQLGTFQYWQGNWNFEFRKKGWKKPLLDCGTETRDSEGKRKPILCDDGKTPVHYPVLLDGDGQKLADDADPVYLEFDDCEEKPFAALVSNLIFV